MNFSNALDILKLGLKLQRSGWNGKGMYIAIKNTTLQSEMTHPYLYMKTADHQLVPWLASQTDILANDWQIFPE